MRYTPFSKQYDVALVAGQSSCWPSIRQVTANIAYIRMHGPRRLFASSYSKKELEEWAVYIKGLKVSRVYVYFNNDFHGYALRDAQKMRQMLELN